MVFHTGRYKCATHNQILTEYFIEKYYKQCAELVKSIRIQKYNTSQLKYSQQLETNPVIVKTENIIMTISSKQYKQNLH